MKEADIATGDFEEVYGVDEGDDSEHEPQLGQWDAVLTCFFIDTVKSSPHGLCS